MADKGDHSQQPPDLIVLSSDDEGDEADEVVDPEDVINVSSDGEVDAVYHPNMTTLHGFGADLPLWLSKEPYYLSGVDSVTLEQSNLPPKFDDKYSVFVFPPIKSHANEGRVKIPVCRKNNMAAEHVPKQIIVVDSDDETDNSTARTPNTHLRIAMRGMVDQEDNYVPKKPRLQESGIHIQGSDINPFEAGNTSSANQVGGNGLNGIHSEGGDNFSLILQALEEMEPNPMAGYLDPMLPVPENPQFPAISTLSNSNESIDTGSLFDIESMEVSDDEDWKNFIVFPPATSNQNGDNENEDKDDGAS